MCFWGNEIGERDVHGYPAPDNVRNALEPDRTIQTEPDVVLHVPGRLLVLIEASSGPRTVPPTRIHTRPSRIFQTSTNRRMDRIRLIGHGSPGNPPQRSWGSFVG